MLTRIPFLARPIVMANENLLATSVRRVWPSEIEPLLPAFVELLRETVNDGSPLGFVPPITPTQARDYWLSLRPELYAGSRVLLATFAERRVIGSGQLRLPTVPNGLHRAEVQKVFVSNARRGRGIGRVLMAALHDAARQHGRNLLLLNTRRGGRAEAFYKRLGYREVGVVPGYTMGTAGERHDSTALYRQL
ncbi:MAG TPA: GNAT family N-acetyltransferase [Gemmatimonadaceae bacterium]|jgi:GNAT superfamily N-acetyltransferase|nr:GNAT family N-acetyltransferase [Gemmatimonadaceae bacterium]